MAEVDSNVSPTPACDNVADTHICNVKFARKLCFVLFSCLESSADFAHLFLGQFVMASRFPTLSVWRPRWTAKMFPCVKLHNCINRSLRRFVIFGEMFDSLTRGISRADRHYLIVRKFRKTRCFATCFAVPSFLDTILRVFFWCSCKKVARITTWWIVAVMAHLHPSRIGIGEDVSPPRAVFGGAIDIDRNPLKRFRSNPRPASIWTSRFVDFIPKAFPGFHSLTLTSGWPDVH